MLATAATTKIPLCHQYGCTLINGSIQLKIRILLRFLEIAPIEKQELAKTGSLDSLEKLLGNNLIGIDINPVQRRDQACVLCKWLHVSIAFAEKNKQTKITSPTIAPDPTLGMKLNRPSDLDYADLLCRLIVAGRK